MITISDLERPCLACIVIQTHLFVAEPTIMEDQDLRVTETTLYLVFVKATLIH